VPANAVGTPPRARRSAPQTPGGAATPARNRHRDRCRTLPLHRGEPDGPAQPRPRLDLSVFGPVPQIDTLARTLLFTLHRAEADSRRALRTYSVWLRRNPREDYDPRSAPALRRAWRSRYLAAWVARWAVRMRAARSGDLVFYAGPLAFDHPGYPADRAAEHDADELWLSLQGTYPMQLRTAREAAALQAEDDRALGRAPTELFMPIPTAPDGALIAPGVTLLPRPPHPSRHAACPVPRRLDYTELPLWNDPPPPPTPPGQAPAREEARASLGRPLTETLADFMV